MNPNRFYFFNKQSINAFVNRWDILLLLLLMAILFFLGHAGSQMAVPYRLGTPIPISLNPWELPFYALRTVLRMFIALFFSILFTLVVGTLAAKSRRAEQIIIPAIDVLQSVPVLSFLAMTITGFIGLFPGSLLGPECAAIFVIFTAQVWNITFSFYQSLKTIPHDLYETAAVFQLSSWQRFWKIEVPCSMSGLLWNIMMSMSASWFFVVLSEAIAVAYQEIRLPGIGSYIARAIEEHNLYAVGYAIIAMVTVIFIYDQVLFRPLIAWSDKFKLDDSRQEQAYESWLMDWLRHSRLIRRLELKWAHLKDGFVNTDWLRRRDRAPVALHIKPLKPRSNWLWNTLVWLLIFIASLYLMRYIFKTLGLHDVLKVLFLGAITGARVLVLIALSSLIWVPVGVWIGLRPKWAQKVQPVLQFLAAIPANLFYPLFVIAIVYYHLNVEIWVTPLMILGTQWYILFNVIAGAAMIPRDLCLAVNNFGVKGWQWWRRLALPAVFSVLHYWRNFCSWGCLECQHCCRMGELGRYHTQSHRVG